MTDDDGLSWVPLLVAARQLGKRTDAVRSMIRRDKLTTRKGNDGRVLIGVPTADGRATDGSATAGDQADDGHATAELMQEIMELRERLARAEAEREAARSTAQAEVAAKEQIIAEVRAQIAREIARGDALATELAEARRPWWRKLIGGAVLIAALQSASASAAPKVGFDWTLVCEARASASAYDLNSNPEKLELDNLNEVSKYKIWFTYRDGTLGRYIAKSGEEPNLAAPAPLILEILAIGETGAVLAKNPVQIGTAIEVWRIDLTSRQAQNVGISELFGGGVSFGFYRCGFLRSG